MQLEPEYLRRHYASLSDEALLAIDGTELVDQARKCYDEELARRELTLPDSARSAGSGDDDRPAWLEEAACVYTFAIFPGGQSAPDAANARAVLDAAGILCYLDLQETDPAVGSQAENEYRLMVPAKLSLLATSVLDKEIFNAEVEAEWRTYFEALSDDELGAVDTQVLFGGLLDRIQRVTKAYDEEMARRWPETTSGGA